jgi:predicted transcriptional regulator
MAAAMDRPDLYVVARVLERLWREEAPMLRTRLQVASKVNYDVFIKYLDWMLAKGLVELRPLDGGKEGIVLTPKGEEAYRRLVQWIDEIILGARSR